MFARPAIDGTAHTPQGWGDAWTAVAQLAQESGVQILVTHSTALLRVALALGLQVLNLRELWAELRQSQ
jgi:hypothetical protein